MGEEPRLLRVWGKQPSGENARADSAGLASPPEEIEWVNNVVGAD
jgi:hypothetical protein